ncbi:hypothetical protein BJV78DRAFT_704788 [Lactifluus subvellereus]|nr:hypothetical protein BJV78DRAFT_704788 [Lactifluus subvellereus]
MTRWPCAGTLLSFLTSRHIRLGDSPCAVLYDCWLGEIHVYRLVITENSALATMNGSGEWGMMQVEIC